MTEGSFIGFVAWLAVFAVWTVVFDYVYQRFVKPRMEHFIRTRLIETGWADRAGLWLRNRVRALLGGGP